MGFLRDRYLMPCLGYEGRAAPDLLFSSPK